MGSFDSFIKEEPSCQHRALSALQGCFPRLFCGTLSQSRVGDLYVGKRPPNAKHSPGLKRVFSRLLQCPRGFQSFCLLVVHRAFPGPQVCGSTAPLASKSLLTCLVTLKDQFPGKERGILGHCLGGPLENPGSRPHPRPVSPGISLHFDLWEPLAQEKWRCPAKE